MNKITVINWDESQAPQVFNLSEVTSAEDIIAVPAIQDGRYLLENESGNQITDGVSLSRHNNDLRIHTEASVTPSAIIADYYNSPALLTVPATNNIVQTLNVADVQETPVSVSLLAEPPYLPWSDGYISNVSVNDDFGIDQGEIPNNGGTDDLTPTLQGMVINGGGLVLTIYANTVEMGSVVVADDGSWFFTPAEGQFAYDTNYTFQTLLKDPGGSDIFIALPFSFTLSADATPSDSLPHTGNEDLIVIDHLVDDVGVHQGNTGNNGVTDDLAPTIEGTVFGGEGLVLKVWANTLFLGTTLVDDTGRWTFDITGLEDNAQYNIQVILTDPGSGAAIVALPFVFNTGFDVPAPIITSVVDNTGSVQGPLAEEQPTNDDLPTINGTADANAVVNIYDGDTLLGSALTNENGVWTFTPESPLSGEGPHFISATTTDGTSESAHSGDFNLNLDTVIEKPVITGVEDDVGLTTGNVVHRGVSDDSRPLLSGTAEANSTVVIRVTGANGYKHVIGSVVADENGLWEYQATANLPGQYTTGTRTFNVISTDAAGNTSTSDGYVITIVRSNMDDVTPPDTAINQQLDDNQGDHVGPIASGDTTDDATPTYTGDAEPGAIVIISDNGKAIGSVVANDSGQWSFTPATPLPDGEHSFSTIVKDSAGNMSEPSNSIDFTVDTTPPAVIDVTVPDNLLVTDDVGTQVGAVEQNGVTDDNLPTFSGKNQTAGDIITILDGGVALGTAVVKADGSWEFTPTEAMADGAHSITLVATDPVGNSSEPSAAFDFTIDTAPPAVIDVTVPDNLLVTDDVGPLVGAVEQNGVTDDNLPTFSGKNQTTGDIITILDGGVALGSAVVKADGSWEFTPTEAMADGAHSITLVATDPAGNSSEPSAAFDFTIDTAPPAVIDVTVPDNLLVTDDFGPLVGAVEQNGVTDDNLPTFSGKNQTANDIITILDGGVALGSAVVKADGSWEFTPTEAMADGAHSITLVATDPAGNSSEPSAAFDFTIAAAVPDAATDIVINDDAGAEKGVIVPGGSTDDTSPTIDGNAEPGSTVIINDNGEAIGSVVVEPDGTWSFTPETPLDGGSHSIDTVVVDPVTGGESAPSTPIEFSVVTEGSDNFETAAKAALIVGEPLVLASGLVLTSLDSGRDAGSYLNEITSKGIVFFAPESYGTQALALLADSVTRLDFGGVTNTVSFDTSAVSGAGGFVHYYDADGNELNRLELPASEGKEVNTVAWTAPEGEFISYVTINVGPESGDSLIRVDNFSWGDTQVQGAEVPAPVSYSLAGMDVQDAADVALLSQVADAAQASVNVHESAEGKLTLSLDDVISQAEQNLFINDGSAQFAVTGEAGEHVELTGVTESSLAQQGSVTSGGMTYDVYTVAGSNTELLVQQGLELQAAS
ncbi:Ig-like domain-containing protein [Pseudomonas sp. M30-35]|uniref:Ig-like domain-containing protein n=1 Tax=Pseudomonas sp. M30-35 TaxID=1981174 RepID=UPI000B3D0634|nr:Ig-like domain-containing protein [Pseudomonas sp. M30-35]ARU90151.1 hypothetical protein B9K09_20320 [Pseudomonas sp. M30-35]